ncbi:P-loop containing nucleoside triphosphate hydrolase [Apiospora marii]|uniref:P-loop containing nucleoside triphosphate hydrolase n=1 Tax=Apiospora marii TaxID=335849 RepID=UPI00312F2D84
MEPVTALSVSAAAVQFFGVVVKATALCREIRDNADSATDHNRDLEVSVRELQDVQAQLANAAQSSKPSTRRRIASCVAKCNQESNDLLGLLEEVRGAGKNRSTLKNVCRALRNSRKIEKLERSLLSKRDSLHGVLQQENWHLSESQETKLREILEGLSQINVVIGEALKGKTIQIMNGLNQTDSDMKTLFAQSESNASRRHNQTVSETQRRFEESEAKENVERFLQTLFFPEILERQSQIKGAAPGTLEWIFETEDFNVPDQMDPLDTDEDTSSHDDVTLTDQEDSSESESSYEGEAERTWDDLAAWLRNDNGVYWISGKAASGKSTLIAHVVDDLRTRKALDVWRGRRKCHILSYFFWRPGTDMQKKHSCPERTQALMKRLAIRTLTMHRWNEKWLRKAFCELINIATRSCFCVFVDGLDEFNGNHGELVDLIFELQGHERVKFCVSSRPEVQLSKRLSSCRSLRLQDLNLSDITQFVKHKLSEVKIDIGSSSGNLHDEIAERAEGVFLWAVLVTESLVRGIEVGDDANTLSQRIKTIPQGLNDLFKSMLNKVEKVHQESLAFYLHALSICVRYDNLISIANLTASKAPSTLSSLASFEIACKQTESQVMAQSAGLIEIGESGRPWDFYRWDPAYVWLKVESSTIPVTRKLQTDSVEYPATLKYEAKAIKWVHRSAYDFVWDQDNVNVLSLSQTMRENVLRQLYRGYVGLIIYSPSSGPGGYSNIMNHTESRLKELFYNMGLLWNSYTLATREAADNLRLSFAKVDYREIFSDELHRGLENPTSDWAFWHSCSEASFWDYILDSFEEMPLSSYGSVIYEAMKIPFASPFEKLMRLFRNRVVRIFEKSPHGHPIRLLRTSDMTNLSISYNPPRHRRKSPASLATEKFLVAYVIKAITLYGYRDFPNSLDHWYEIITTSGLFIEVANSSPHLYMQAFASVFLKGENERSNCFGFRPNAFRIISFPFGKASPLSDDPGFETDRFVYFDTTPDTTKHVSQYLRRSYKDPWVIRWLKLIATIDEVRTCHQKIIDDFRANEQKLEATEKTRVVECLEAHLWDMLMSIRKEPDPRGDEIVSLYPVSVVENESAVSEDYKGQTGEQEAELLDEGRPNRVVDEEDSSDWLTDDGDSTASFEEAA